MAKWLFIESAPRSAKENMEHDALLLDELSDRPILHFYEWKHPAATFGHFIKPEEHFKEKTAIDLAKRPTGGGIIFHHTDLAFSVLMPINSSSFSLNTLENYAWVNNRVIDAIDAWVGQKTSLLPCQPCPVQDSTMHHFCMSHPTIYDIVLKGKKVGGAAQRRTKKGFLHQATVALGLPNEEFLGKVLIHSKEIFNHMHNNSHPLLGEKWTAEELNKARSDLKQEIAQSFLFK